MSDAPVYDKENGYWGERWVYSDTYPVMLAHSRSNRISMTPAEAALWSQIRGRRLGDKFRRQYIIGDYIADFVCIEKHLIIEVDGGYHQTREQQREDQIRTDCLSRYGFKVVRYTNEEVTIDTDRVVEEIKILLKNINQ